MKKTNETYKRKIFFGIRLALLIILVNAVFKTALIQRSADKTLSPKSTSGSEYLISVARKGSIGETGKKSESSIQDYSVIFERNLFENPTSSRNTEKELKVRNDSDLEDLTQEELSIALLGTVVGSPGISRAIIEDLETNILSLFKVGDTVGNASIENIERDTVVLLHHGQRKTVHLGAKGSKQYQANKTESMLARNSNRAFERDPQDRAPATVAEKFRYAATMLPKAVIKPYAVDGKIEGLKITGLEEIKYMEDIGLRNGDVIRTVNGHRLTSKQEAFQISRKVRSQAVVSIELMRDNKVKTFSFHLS